MMTLEVFISQRCPSCDAAIKVAKKAVEAVSGVMLIIRKSDQTDRARAQSLGIFISPTFVLEGKICEIGVPDLEKLIGQLREVCQNM